MRYVAIIVALISMIGCGSGGSDFDSTVPTQTDPYINRIDPTAASAGDVVSIFGRGFSDVAQLNVVIIDGTPVLADTHSLVTPATDNEIESLTFTVPVGINAGVHSIYVDVLDNVSNADITITIN